MLFYPVKYHPPATASSVIRVIKPTRRAACIDRSTAKRPEHTGDKVSPRGGCQGGCAARRVGSYETTAWSDSLPLKPRLVSCAGCPDFRPPENALEGETPVEPNSGRLRAGVSGALFDSGGAGI